MSDASLTVSAALRLAAQRLAATSDTPRLDAELLMALALETSRSELLLRHMGALAPQKFDALVSRRAAHEPVAYITGFQEFYGRNFAVNPAVLIPRSDSETIIDAVLSTYAAIYSSPHSSPSPARILAPARILDCGTGSGALLLTLLAEYENAQGAGIDRSRAALDVAASNAARLSLTSRARFSVGDWTKPGWADGLGYFDLIIANPPYVEENAELSPTVRDWEPAGALFSGAQGLDDYRILIPQLAGLLAPKGIIVLEIGASQADQVSQIAAEEGYCSMMHKDLSGRPRALVLQLGVGKPQTNS